MREDLAPLRSRHERPTPAPDPLELPGYAEKIASLDGEGESVTTSLAELAGQQVVVAMGDFFYLGGSMGQVHGDRGAEAMAVALEQRLPFLAVISSGGARMQEDMVSLIQMARAAEGVRRLRAAGLPGLTHFTHSTTGGVHAAYGVVADVVIADVGATVGFAGTATGLLASWVELLHLALRDGPLPAADHVAEPVVEHDAWDAVQAARRPDRPSARDLLSDVFDDHLELRGDRAGTDDGAAVAAIARLGQRRVFALGFDRRGGGDGSHGSSGRSTAAGFRKLCAAAPISPPAGACRW